MNWLINFKFGYLTMSTILKNEAKYFKEIKNSID
jgi:hypothetical protein